MRYMIAHMLKGDAKAYHANLSTVLASMYHLRPVTNIIDPHLTIKSAFEATEISEVEQIVSESSLFAEAAPYMLKGFNAVADRLIFMNVEPSLEMNMVIQKIQNQLQNIPWLEFRSHEIPPKLHATLCFPKSRTQRDDMLERLRKVEHAPSFECMFDNIAILKRGERRWEILKEYSIG